jgi:adenine-specific DNA-methyltransferase
MVIFLSIDGTEVSNLEHLLNNVFGEENKITSIVGKKSK